MSSKNPFLSVDQQIVGDIFTSTEVMDNLTILCDDFGARFGGTEEERLAAEFLHFICVYLRKSASKKIKIMPVGSICQRFNSPPNRVKKFLQAYKFKRLRHKVTPIT